VRGVLQLTSRQLCCCILTMIELQTFHILCGFLLLARDTGSHVGRPFAGCRKYVVEEKLGADAGGWELKKIHLPHQLRCFAPSPVRSLHMCDVPAFGRLQHRVVPQFAKTAAESCSLNVAFCIQQ
jgi:hypothetical protein